MSEVTRSAEAGEASAGALVSRLAEQISTLVRDELRLAQAELTHKAKRAGMGRPSQAWHPAVLGQAVASTKIDIETIKESANR